MYIFCLICGSVIEGSLENQDLDLGFVIKGFNIDFCFFENIKFLWVYIEILRFYYINSILNIYRYYVD